MGFAEAFTAPGKWYKANLHAHTTASDGKLSPEEVAVHYRRQGYDVLAITDHGQVVPCAQFSAPDFLCLEGIELSLGRSETGSTLHIIGLGVPIGIEVGTGPQEALDTIAAAGGVGLVAHPYWSCLIAHDLQGLRHCLGIEVFNYGCELEIGKGTSSVHWDDLLVRGERYLGLAVDDGHRCGWDFYGGFTMIKAEELSREAVLEALQQGHCYGSMGPLIHDLQVDAERVRVECTPAAAIRFVANDQHGWCIQKREQPPLTGARHLRSSSERYVRVEIVDETGLRAWGQPVFAGE